MTYFITHRKTIAVYSIVVLLSLTAAFINGFPFSYMDLGTYIDSGFRGYAPADRPVFYGWFLRHISLSRYLFLVIGAQAFFACWLMRDLIKNFVKPEHVNLVFILVILLLVTTTSYSVVVSLLIPDIFSALSYLVLVNLLWSTNRPAFVRVCYYVAFVFFIITQNASILSFMLVVPCLLLVFWFKKDLLRLRISVKVLLSILISLLLIMGHNYVSTGKARLSASSHVFIMSRFIEFGLVQDYLHTNCDKKNYRICAYKDSLQWDFIFNKNSVVFKTGGWEANKEEYNTIIKDMLFSKKYGPAILLKTTEGALKQLYTFDAYVGTPLLQGTPPYAQIKWRFDNELKRYESSKQNRGTFDVTRLNQVQVVIVVISLIVLSIGVVSNHSALFSVKGPVIILLFYMVVNAFVVSFFATVDPRYQTRTIWLLPFFALLVGYDWYRSRRNTTTQIENN